MSEVKLNDISVVEDGNKNNTVSDISKLSAKSVEYSSSKPIMNVESKSSSDDTTTIATDKNPAIANNPYQNYGLNQNNNSTNFVNVNDNLSQHRLNMKRSVSLYADVGLYTDAVVLGFDPEYLAVFEDKIFIEGPQTNRKYMNFFCLLFFATVIATYGVLSDSTATVIGAMIVAPLMQPIMGTTAGVVMGHFKRSFKAVALVGVGIGSVILVSLILSLLVPSTLISFTNNFQITSRINPDLLSMLCALGSGGAGAFILSRAEIADSMGGVAIAISLVPPLCVVGISLKEAEFTAAGGAMILFTTNFLAILFAGGLVYMLLGLGRVSQLKQPSDRKIFGISYRYIFFSFFFICCVLISAPLTYTTIETVQILNDTKKSTNVIQKWCGTSLTADYQVDAVTVTNNGIQVVTTIQGQGPLPSVDLLASQLSNSLKRDVAVTVKSIFAMESNSTNQ